jgi:hypothetical protein
MLTVKWMFHDAMKFSSQGKCGTGMNVLSGGLRKTKTKVLQQKTMGQAESHHCLNAELFIEPYRGNSPKMLLQEAAAASSIDGVCWVLGE